MNMATNEFVRKLEAKLGQKLATLTEVRGETTIEVLPENWLAVAALLRDDAELHFEQAMDLCGVDYLSYGDDEWDTRDVTSTGFSRGVEGRMVGRFKWGESITSEHGSAKGIEPATSPSRRFAVVVHLLSLKYNRRLRLRAHCADDELPGVPSLIGIWPSVDWFEREAFDLYGIVFEGHPDLRRILTDYGFIGHPFRKDFPVSGYVEMRYDPEEKRVVYQPVTIEPREITPRVIREDRYGGLKH
jgi:NADH-quinone oxidoreductase subunit C